MFPFTRIIPNVPVEQPQDDPHYDVAGEPDLGQGLVPHDGLEGADEQNAELREGQQDYACDAAQVFLPRERQDNPHLLLAQAGTGIGKTLGYLAPASLWSAASQGTVWVST